MGVPPAGPTPSLKEEELIGWGSRRTSRIKDMGGGEEDLDSQSGLYAVVERVNRNGRCRCCLWVAALWCAATVVFMLAGYDAVVEKVAVGQMVLNEGNQKYEAWVDSPVPVYYKVYAFNLTNPESFMAGARPRMKELGPYVYLMKEKKEAVQFHSNGTVTYQTRPFYYFQPEMSQGLQETDPLVTVNIPFVNAADAVKDQGFLRMVIQVAKKLHGFQTLRRITVRELLWGHRSRVIDWARTMQELPYPHQLFGLLVGFNDSVQEPYTMYTGEDDPAKMNQIYSWNGKQSLDFWGGPACNTIRGTDANGFHPNVRKTDRLYIFNGQLCRSIPLVYKKTINRNGITAYRFGPPADVFSYGPEHPENSCYCSRGGCLASGVLDMKPCYWGASVAFSFPHFYQADAKLRHIVRGLSPDPERHATEFDIYPDLGVPLRVKLRMQMNVVLDSDQALERARHFDVIFPVFWFEVGIESLPGEVVGLLKLAQNLPPVVKTTSVSICLVLIVLFLVLLLAQTVVSWCSRNHAKSKGEPGLGTEWDYSSIHRSRPGLDSGSSSAGSTLPPHLPLDENGVPFIDDHTLLPPYRRRHFPDTPDAQHDAAEDPHDPVPPYTPTLLEVAPPYTTMPDQPARTPSTVSVEIHTTASEEEIPTEGSTPRDGPGDDTSIEDEAPETPRKEPLPEDENDDKGPNQGAPTPAAMPNGDVPIIVPPAADPGDSKDRNRDHTPSAPAPTPTPSVYSGEDPPARPPPSPQSPKSPRSPPLATSSPHNSTGPESPPAAVPPPPQQQQHRPPPLESEL